MNADILKEKLLELKRAIRHRWGKQKDDDLDVVPRDGEMFIGTLQERAAGARERARKELDKFMNSGDGFTRDKS